MSTRLNVLFVCGKNKRRSPTAEKIFKNDPRMSVRSAGTGETSRRRLTEADLLWANVIFVMQRKYTSRIKSMFRSLDFVAPIISLDITDDYTFMDSKLISLLYETVEHELENLNQDAQQQ